MTCSGARQIGYGIPINGKYYGKTTMEGSAAFQRISAPPGRRRRRSLDLTTRSRCFCWRVCPRKRSAVATGKSGFAGWLSDRDPINGSAAAMVYRFSSTLLSLLPSSSSANRRAYAAAHGSLRRLRGREIGLARASCGPTFCNRSALTSGINSIAVEGSAAVPASASISSSARSRFLHLDTAAA